MRLRDSCGPVSGRDNSSNLTPVRTSEQASALGSKHRFRATVLLPDEVAEADEIATEIRDAMPSYSPCDEPSIAAASALVWRLRRAYADLLEHGVVRGRGQPAPLLRSIDTTERS